MIHLRRIVLKFSSLFTNTRTEKELEREIAAHLSLLEDEFLGPRYECCGRTAGRQTRVWRRGAGQAAASHDWLALLGRWM